jgi:pseudaminic acid synthase
MFKNKINVVNKELYRYCDPFIVAEISSNHEQDFEKAKQLIDLAKEANADAVKFQTFEPESLTLNSQKSYFNLSKNSNWRDYNQYSLYSKGATPKAWLKDLYEYSFEKNLVSFSTPFSAKDVEFLEELSNPIYKIASYESNHFELIKEVLRTNKPVFISLGGTNSHDLDELIKVLVKSNNKQIVLLNCVCSYPADEQDSNISKIISIFDDYGFLAGFSDHSNGSKSAVVAASLGAVVFEKHIMLDEGETLDKDFSSNLDDFTKYVNDIKEVNKILGTKNFQILESEKPHTKSRRSIFTTESINKGEPISIKNIAVVRPADGLHPKYFQEIIGRKAKKFIEKHEPLKLEDLE